MKQNQQAANSKVTFKQSKYVADWVIDSMRASLLKEFPELNNNMKKTKTEDKKTQLNKVIKKYFAEVDDYYEALDAFIYDVNQIIREKGEDPRDAGIISSSRVQEIKKQICNLF